MKYCKKNFYCICILMLILIIQTILLTYTNIKMRTPYLKSIKILGNEIKIDPNVFVYYVNLEYGELMKVYNNSCELPLYYEVNTIHGKDHGYQGSSSLANGETMAYFTLYFSEPKSEKNIATYYFELSFDNPIKIADGCY